MQNILIKQQVYQLQIEIAMLEVEINKMKHQVHDKKITLSRLTELLEIRGIFVEK